MQSHICLNTIHISCTFFFRRSRSLIPFRSSRTFIEKYRMFYKTSHTIINIKNIFRSSRTNFHGFYTKYTHFESKSLSCMNPIGPNQRKNGRFGPCIQTIFPFVMTMSKHNAYRHKQIIQACFVHMSQCLDHRL